ncbi:MAG: HPF/RaiA family ribosome-associated protein [Candidatus Rokubacteria bacterium]|nr:HPF/RaiA family ribosome-associated protein [Candidatus Rokubacteria bacterium]MBI2016736.1 HPF/RaiA family ribosome-associated protein [Candidatus Rokubacteria bacterium]
MTATKVQFRGASQAPELRGPVAAAVGAVLDALPVRPTSVRATFTDENGPKGGRAIRCALEVRLPRRPAVHVEALATTARLAFDGALAKLERQLGRVRDTVRELKRRPKKYFAARRALAP